MLAHMWLNIASVNGDEGARESRDTLERDMTRAEISRATELARDVHGLGLPGLRAVSKRIESTYIWQGDRATVTDVTPDGEEPVPRGPRQRLPICTVLNNHYGSGAAHRVLQVFSLAVKNGFLICHIVTGL